MVTRREEGPMITYRGPGGEGARSEEDGTGKGYRGASGLVRHKQTYWVNGTRGG